MNRPFKLLSYSLLSFLLIACAGVSFAVRPDSTDQTQDGPAASTPTAAAPAQLGATAEIPRPTPTAAALGTVENPLILALSPGSASDQERVDAGKALAEQLSEITGYTYVVVAPESYAKLVESMGRGNAHLAVLSGPAYALAYKKGYANAAYASIKSGEKAYGAQFIARTDAGFKSYYDVHRDKNTADAAIALSQFRDKKPCWPDEVSLSGYVVPVGVLAHNDILVRQAALVLGQPTVVQAVYAGDVCDFGATYMDARRFPLVVDKYPDVLDEVKVIWRIPSVIPFETFVLARQLPPEITLSISDALFRITGTQDGRQALGRAYGVEEWERITDAFYEEFRLYLNASGVDLESILD
jgi:ABC-type phosphate/phosphonate transport system substrate-binding protein